jgi:hypothetical protein
VTEQEKHRDSIDAQSECLRDQNTWATVVPSFLVYKYTIYLCNSIIIGVVLSAQLGDFMPA